MDDIVELDNIKNVCRLCLSTDEPKIDIFGIKESSLPFDELIHQHLLIEVASDDKLSTLICEGCIDKVKEWHIYKESCKKSQEKLQQWLVKKISNNSLNMDPSVEDDTNVKSPAELSQADVSVEDIIPEEISSIENDSTLNTTMDDVSMESIEEDSPVKNEELKTQKNTKVDKIEIKREPHDDYDNIDVESVADSELLVNPMAGVTNKIIEPDSTQKFTKSKKKIRRGLRTHFRGVRAFKKKCSHCQVILHSKFSYKNHMQRYHNDDNNLIENSDNNTKEIETGNSTEDDEYYDGEKQQQQQQEQQQQQSNEDDEVMDDEESIEDVEDELISMEKNAPLTQVQENIISQLKTFSCYSCQQVFNDRRSTLNHIRQHMPDLRPYTCIACLTEFPDRSIYKLHCGASFECAMKIALVTPKHGTEKYFTCNMCLRPMPNRKDLLTHLSKHSDRQYEQLTAPQKTPIKLKPTTTANIQTTPMNNSSNKKTNNKLINPSLLLGPYQNGAPSHNHTCIYCGMIYKHKPNMLKHRELCQRLPPHERNSYHCAHCGLTFLIFKKFQSHTNTEHRRKEIICYLCGSKYKHAHEFLAHYQEHRDSNNDNKNNKIIKYGCPLCPKEFKTQNELQQHKTSHLKLKNTDKPLTIDDDLKLIGNCSMQQEQQQQDTPIFSPPSGEPGSRSTECRSCGKIFANYPNLRRHVRTAHIINGRFCCPNCTKTFTSEDLWIQHGQRAHPRDIEASTILITCQQCKKVFNDAEQHSQHLIEEHGIDEDDHLACDICGKRFSNETSLKIHRGHHFRRDSRLSIRNIPNPMEQVQVEIVEGTNELNLSPIKIDKLTSPSSIRSSSPSKVKKNLMLDSFNDLSNDNNDDEDEGDDDGNNIDDDGGDDVDDDEANNDDIDNSKSLQCTVCNNNFNDIQDLRKHLVDVHCTGNKIDDSFNDELQCNLCPNVFNDEQSLDEHIKWHKEDSLLNDVVRAPPDIMCDICGKYYSSIKSLTKHKKLHKTNSANIKFTSVKKPPITASFPCPICKKVFNNENSMKKHKAGAHYARRTIASIAAAAAAAAAAASTSTSTTTSPSIPLSVATPSPRKSSTKSDDSEIRPKRPKLDFDIIRKAYNLGEPSGSSVGTPNTSKKAVTCGICKKLFPTKSSLYKHRSNVHKITSKSPIKNETTDDTNDDNSGGGGGGSVDDDGVQCSDCFKIFSNSSNMRQHYTKVHGNGEKHYCTIDDCNEEFDTSVAKQLHEKSHMSMLFQCNYCDKYMFNRGAIDSHLLTDHSSNVNDDNLNDEKKHFKKVDLGDYEVKGADGRVCPVCLIKYPNIKALKIHYVKIHEGNT